MREKGYNAQRINSGAGEGLEELKNAQGGEYKRDCWLKRNVEIRGREGRASKSS